MVTPLGVDAAWFTGRVPITTVREVSAIDGVLAATPFSWFGGKYGDRAR